MWKKTLIVALAATLLTTGCQFRADAVPETPQVMAKGSVAAQPIPPVITVSDVVGALEGAGMTVEEVASASFDDLWQTKVTPLSVDGTHVSVGIYPGEPSVKFDEHGQTDKAHISWVAKPHVLTVSNMTVIVTTNDDAAAERVLAPLQQRFVGN